MNTPTPTEAHLDLVESVRYSNDRSAALQIADSEARAVAAAVTALTCTHHNDQQRAACPVCIVTTLTAERDQLRAENERLKDGGVQRLKDTLASTLDARDAAIARAERAEAEIIRLRTENSDLKATDTRPLLTGKLTHAGFCRIGEDQLDGVFINIDREQIKALRHLPMYARIELRVAAMQEGAK